MGTSLGSAVSPGCSLPSFFHPLLEGRYLGTAWLCWGHHGCCAVVAAPGAWVWVWGSAR